MVDTEKMQTRNNILLLLLFLIFVAQCERKLLSTGTNYAGQRGNGTYSSMSPIVLPIDKAILQQGVKFLDTHQFSFILCTEQNQVFLWLV